MMKQLIKPIRIHIIFDVIFSAFSNISLAMLPFFIQKLLNGDIKIAIIGYILCIFLFLMFNYIQMFIEWKQAILFSSSLKNSWYDALQWLSHSDFKQKSVPEYLSYQANDLDALEKDYLPPLVSLFKQILRIVIFSIVIGTVVNPKVAIILFVCSLISIQIPKIFGKRIAKKRTIYLNKQAEYYEQLDDLLKAHHLVDINSIDNVKSVQRKSLDILQREYFNYGLVKSLGLTLTGLSFHLTDIILFIYLAFSISQGTMTIPQIVASLSYINAFSEPIQEILYDIQMLESVRPIKLTFQEIISRSPSLKKPIPFFDTIELRNIEKRVGDNVLKIPYLSIKYGDKIAIVGENGSGKSSFLNILNGTDDNFSGDVFVDGQIIKNLDSCFGKIIQKDHAFRASYESNVSMFNSFPIKTVTEELSMKKGNILSGGEKQCMFIEREINRCSPLIIMDEPFSALDDYQFNLQINRVLNLENTVIVAIHQKEEVLHLFSQVWRISEGELSVEYMK